MRSIVATCSEADRYRLPAQEHFLTALSQPRQEDRVDDVLIETAQPSKTVSKEQLSTLKREREASRGFATVDLFGRMVNTNDTVHALKPLCPF